MIVPHVHTEESTENSRLSSCLASEAIISLAVLLRRLLLLKLDKMIAYYSQCFLQCEHVERSWMKPPITERTKMQFVISLRYINNSGTPLEHRVAVLEASSSTGDALSTRSDKLHVHVL